MRKLFGVLLAAGLSLGPAHSAYAADAERSRGSDAAQAEPQDAVWGIGKRSAEIHTAPAEESGETLERAFWVCDYAATTRGFDGTPVALCGAVYEELKNTKFAGDFLQLLVWWQQNKPVEHRRIATEQPGPTAAVGGL